MAQPIIPLPPEEATTETGEMVRSQTPRWVDALMLVVVLAIVYGVLRAVMTWRAPLNNGTRVSLDLWHLPLYAALSTLRMALAYAISLVFSLLYAKIAAASKTAERFMLPLLDILQSIPILSFMPGVVIGLASLFPGRALGLELAAILLIFTSQAWNMAFSFHQSLLTIPHELSEAATVYRLGPWRRFTLLELPFGAISLIANSMMSWAGGWFFLIAAEQFTLGKSNYELPGLGSFLQEATRAGNMMALLLGLLTLIAIIIALDFFLWRPLVAWSDRFKFEQSGAGDVPPSKVLEWIQGSALIDWIQKRTAEPIGQWLNRTLSPPRLARIPFADDPEPTGNWLEKNWKGLIATIIVSVIVGWGAIASVQELAGLPAKDWGTIGMGAGATFLRTLAALILAAAWTIPVGVAIGLNPKWSHRAQPIIQIIASVPATAVFPLVLAVLLGIPGGLNVAAVLLMLLGTQWYVLFNVVAGAMAIPSDLREAAVNYQVTGWRRWKTLILPAIFPYLVTGMITATGGAWNASIVSEFVTIPPDKTKSTLGLGALITEAANSGNFPLLLAGTLVMAGIVITGNRLVWRRLYGLAATRYRLD
jgi:NitT/TauT family transport system permease protein